MELTNFHLEQSICAVGLGCVWDLHNVCDFAGIELLPKEGAARLRWIVLHSLIPEVARQEGQRGVSSCAIRFDGVSAISAAVSRSRTDLRNATTLDQVSLVSRPAGSAMLFEFMDGFDIEIVAATATLETEPPSDP